MDNAQQVLYHMGDMKYHNLYFVNGVFITGKSY